jgi:MFS family permease
MLLISIVGFLIGSVLCALSPSILVLIIARGIQGLGGGGLMSLGQTVIGDIVPPKERGRFQAYFATVFIISSLGGPVLGGFFAEHLHWSIIFWINLPLSILAYVMTNSVLRRLPRHERPHKLDIAGAALSVIASTALVLALSWGGKQFGWTSWPILSLFVLSALGWVLFFQRLRTAPEPFIPREAVLHPVVRTGIGATFFAVGAMVGLSIYLPIYFEAVLGLTASQSGLVLIGLMGGTVTGATIAGQIMRFVTHYKRPPMIGLAAATVGAGLLAAFPATMSIPVLFVITGAMGVGIGTMFPVTTTAVQNAVAQHQLGTVTGALNFARSLGSAILVALLGAILLGQAGMGAGEASDLLVRGAGAEADIVSAFRGVFIATTAVLALSWVLMAMMKELPLRGRPESPTGG